MDPPHMMYNNLFPQWSEVFKFKIPLFFRGEDTMFNLKSQFTSAINCRHNATFDIRVKFNLKLDTLEIFRKGESSPDAPWHWIYFWTLANPFHNGWTTITCKSYLRHSWFSTGLISSKTKFNIPGIKWDTCQWYTARVRWLKTFRRKVFWPWNVWMGGQNPTASQIFTFRSIVI